MGAMYLSDRTDDLAKLLSEIDQQLDRATPMEAMFLLNSKGALAARLAQLKARAAPEPETTIQWQPEAPEPANSGMVQMLAQRVAIALSL